MKQYGQKRRPKGSGDESEENLRGKVRELEKQIETQRRYIKTLEKQLKRFEAGISDEVDKKELKKAKKGEIIKGDKENCCPQCSGPDFEQIKIWTPSGEVLWMVCKTCQFKEKKKSDN